VSSSLCRSRSGSECEKNGLLFYPKCRDGFRPFGCCTCTPTCPDGMRDDGAHCAKRSYGRGAGQPLTCSDSEEKDGALCYPKCQSPYANGVGPLCWQTSCPTEFPHTCGMFCAEGAVECSQMNAMLGITSTGAGACMLILPALDTANALSLGSEDRWSPTIFRRPTALNTATPSLAQATRD
jgi:hypothetical protein